MTPACVPKKQTVDGRINHWTLFGPDESVVFHFQFQLCVAGTNVYVTFGPPALT